MLHTTDQKFAALADPTRRALLARLSQGAATVGELSAPLDMSQPNVSRHLKILTEAGLITREVQAQYRVYRLAPDALDGIDAWIARLRTALEANYDRLDTVLFDMQNRKS
ncbi:ArsR/SmtB family transcription factor [Roseovarius sp. 2305UL8-3]|uniref:ArsR/SmtB family transcription factor n=1 Tax=Roseovarius conchicola TaxID=3121636 RepID=UPI0035297A11